jgi:hypothetical protein
MKLGIITTGVLTLSAILSGAGDALSQDAEKQPYTFFKNNIKLTDKEVRTIQQGTPVTKILETPVKNEVAVFGAVWVNAPTEDFVERQMDIENFETGDAVLAIKKLSDPPKLEDFATLEIPEEDLEDIRDCKVGDCEVKIDEPALVRLQKEIDWSAPDAHDKANALIRKMNVEAMDTYRKGGDKAFAAYRDKKRPTFLDKEFDGLLANSPYLMKYVPEFHRYLDEYPDAELPGSKEFIYWALNKFGLKPTFRISHVVVYPIPYGDKTEYVIGSKMLYSSHYFHSALELKFLVTDDLRPNAKGYYLVSLNRSRSDGLTGFFGGIVRSAASKEARKGLSTFLEVGKQMLEQGSGN